MTLLFREYLHRPRELAEALARLAEELAVRESACQSMTANYSKTGGSSGGGGDSKDGPLAALADLTTRRDQCRRELFETENEMLNFLDYMETATTANGARNAAILRYRYILRLGWDDIYEALNRRGFHCTSLRTVFNWHRNALDAASQLWEELHQDERLHEDSGV